MVKLISFFEEYCLFFKNMVKTEQEKLSAILTNDITKIEKYITVKQSEAMQLDNFEQKRLDMQKEFGFDNLTFSQIIEKTNGKNKILLMRLFDEIQTNIDQIKHLNQKSMETAQMNLSLNTSLMQGKEKNSDSGLYSPNKKNNQNVASKMMQQDI